MFIGWAEGNRWMQKTEDMREWGSECEKVGMSLRTQWRVFPWQKETGKWLYIETVDRGECPGILNKVGYEGIYWD